MDAEEDYLFGIPWEDVLIPKGVPYLSLKVFFNLRCCSQRSKEFAEECISRLKELSFSGNNSAGMDLAFKVMTVHCRRLDSINLAKCNWLTQDLLDPMLRNNKCASAVNLNEVSMTAVALQPIIIEFKNLKSLKLSKWPLSNGAIEALSQYHNHLLEDLDLSHCPNISERSLRIFFKKLDKLNTLSLAYMPSVTDTLLYYIGRFCKSLRHINLTGCTKITDSGVGSLVTQLPFLQSLLAQNCPHGSRRILNQLKGRMNVGNMGHPALPRKLYMQI